MHRTHTACATHSTKQITLHAALENVGTLFAYTTNEWYGTNVLLCMPSGGCVWQWLMRGIDRTQNTGVNAFANIIYSGIIHMQIDESGSH